MRSNRLLSKITAPGLHNQPDCLCEWPTSGDLWPYPVTRVAISMSEGKDLPYGVEYAKSNRSSCKGCKNIIGEGSLRMSAREPSRFFDGLQDNWFHFACFWKRLKPGRDEINERSIRKIETLNWDDQEKIRAKIEAHVSTPADADDGGVLYLSKLKVDISKMSRNKCKSCKSTLQKGEMRVEIKTRVYVHTDCIKTMGMFVGSAEEMQGYHDLTADQKKVLDMCYPKIKEEPDCDTTDEPTENKSAANKRKATGKCGSESLPKKAADDIFRIAELKTQADAMTEARNALSCYTRYVINDLLLANDYDASNFSSGQILEILVDCVVFGCPEQCKECGLGTFFYSSTDRAYSCTGDVSAYTKCSSRLKNPPRRAFVLPQDVLDAHPEMAEIKINVLPQRVYMPDDEMEIVNRSDKSAFKYLGARALGETGTGKQTAKSSRSTKSWVSKQIVKNGTVVDSEFEFAEVSHVLKAEDDSLYMCSLTSTDLASNRNSYYKIQLLQHDKKNEFYLFRSWGRMGTKIGGTKTETFRSLNKAVQAFQDLFYEKSMNEWENRAKFTKHAGAMELVETDYSDVVKGHSGVTIEPGSKTLLHRSIKELVMMIFDVENMKSAMVEFELDLEKMPLGKLSQKQIRNAFTVLTEMQTILEAKTVNRTKVLDTTNKFYTMIPHCFGMNAPPLIDTFEKIKKKTEMLEMLMEITFAYDVVKKDQDNVACAWRDPVDVHYESLDCKMEYVEPSSEEFDIAKKYMMNTVGDSHNMFNFELVDLIRVERAGEAAKFKSSIGNRRLLWHGSLRTNYGGILSQGLRIAPPEAPAVTFNTFYRQTGAKLMGGVRDTLLVTSHYPCAVNFAVQTGYMFGKGVYFADMMSKSANYCRTHFGEDGLLLLCDVALGSVKEEYGATGHNSSTVKRAGCHSVQGVGITNPDPKTVYQDPEGYTVTYGKPTKGKQNKTGTPFSLLYNEFIVYDVDQIQMKYICRTRFHQRINRKK